MELLKLTGAEYFEEFYALLEKSFPQDERRDKVRQRALFAREEYKLLCCLEDGILKGFLAVWDFDAFCFLEHFAVDPHMRGRGLGVKLLAELSSTTDKPIVLEVELPETEQAIRRIGFYRRNGFYSNEYPYVQPAYSKDKKALPMIIMSRGRTLEKEEFERIRKKLYSAVYGLA